MVANSIHCYKHTTPFFHKRAGICLRCTLHNPKGRPSTHLLQTVIQYSTVPPPYRQHCGVLFDSVTDGCTDLTQTTQCIDKIIIILRCRQKRISSLFNSMCVLKVTGSENSPGPVDPETPAISMLYSVSVVRPVSLSFNEPPSGEASTVLKLLALFLSVPVCQ